MKIFSQPYRRQTPRLDVSLIRKAGAYLLECKSIQDETEILYRLAAVLFVHDWNIVSAEIATTEDETVADRFRIDPLIPENEVDDLKFEAMMNDLERMLFDKHSIVSYLRSNRHEFPVRLGVGNANVEYYMDAGRTSLTISAADRPGLFLCQAHVFALMEISIQSAQISTENGRVRNTFAIARKDERFRETRFRERVSDALRVLL